MISHHHISSYSCIISSYQNIIMPYQDIIITCHCIISLYHSIISPYDYTMSSYDDVVISYHHIASYTILSYHQHHYCHFWIRLFPCAAAMFSMVCMRSGCISLLCILYFLMVKSNAKRTVLNIHGSHHVTQRALAHICKDIKTHGMVAAASRRTMHRERTEFANQSTPFGKLIQELQLKTHKGGCISLPFLHPRLQCYRSVARIALSSNRFSDQC